MPLAWSYVTWTIFFRDSSGPFTSKAEYYDSLVSAFLGMQKLCSCHIIALYYNITCNWAFASSKPESLLLTTPGLSQYCDEISSDLHGAFIDGFVDAMLRSMDKGLIPRYRESLEQGQVSWRLSRLPNLAQLMITSSLLLSDNLHMVLNRI